MISNFKFFNTENIVIPIDLEYPIDLRKNVTQELVTRYINTVSRNGVSWKYNNEEVILLDPLVSIKGLPTVDLDYVIVIYEGINGSFKPPNNAVIYNLDGSVHKVLKMPRLLSKNIHDLIVFSNDNNPPTSFAMNEGGLQFSGFQWLKDQQGKLINSISILFDREWWESRTVDPVNGEISTLLSSGRL